MHNTTNKEKAFLVIIHSDTERWATDDLALEFKSLVLSTGIEVSGDIRVRLREINPRLYIGKGKLQELKLEVEESGANVVIFNDNLNFSQQRNLEEVFGVKTIDRTQLILDIFAQHAHTQEGILQVELAQCEYLLPRLRGQGIALSRLGGGIGTRGPGETKLEVDRRKISEKITRLKKELQKVKDHRQLLRKKRSREKISVCSLVGYTNAGKTTLFNALCSSSQKESSALFTTLDTVSRNCDLGNKFETLVTDTVGFIYKLPPDLVDAFKATLEELRYADLLLHVIDSGSKNIRQIKAAVEETLKELKLEAKNTLLVFNKIDVLSLEDMMILRNEYPEGVFISAAKLKNLDILREKISQALFSDIVEVVVRIPFERMDQANYLHANCEVIKTSYKEKEAVYWLRVKSMNLAHLKRQGLAVKILEK
jgi:GTP-binding protein HflX